MMCFTVAMAMMLSMGMQEMISSSVIQVAIPSMVVQVLITIVQTTVIALPG